MNNQVLVQLGLSEKAAAIYIAALSLGNASVQDIAKGAKLKRPTTYLHIDELLHDGLLERVPIGRKEYFRAVSPKLLETKAERQLSSVREVVTELEALQGSIQGKPNITILEGEKGIQRVYDEVCNANSIRFWSNLATVEGTFQKYFTKIGEAVRKNQIATREIVDDTLESRRSSRAYAEIAGPTYSSRIATMSGIGNDNAIYGDVVALFRITGVNSYVVRIEDPAIVHSMKALFDMAWQSAKPLVR